jgi:DNA-binding transcriptional LysR family regulator
LPTGQIVRSRDTRDGKRIEIRGRYVVAVNESNAHLAAGLAGLGVIQTFAFMAQPHIARGELVPVLADWESERQPVYVVYPASRHLSARLRAFVEWTAGIFASAGLQGPAKRPARTSRK